MRFITDKVCKMSFVALLITMTAAMFYAPNAAELPSKQKECEK